jgi:hypothetical protein
MKCLDTEIGDREHIIRRGILNNRFYYFLRSFFLSSSIGSPPIIKNYPIRPVNEINKDIGIAAE